MVSIRAMLMGARAQRYFRVAAGGFRRTRRSRPKAYRCGSYPCAYRIGWPAISPRTSARCAMFTWFSIVKEMPSFVSAIDFTPAEATECASRGSS